MKTVFEKAYAKLNISLDVSKPRTDGYHDMCMVMQAVSLCDDVEVTVNETGRVRAYSNLPFIPQDDRNLAVKAAKLYFDAAQKTGFGAEIRMNKRIPVGAGMAGGSTDAAATLRALNAFFGNELNTDDLMAVAGKTGSDVPFCLLGGTALAEGRGEILTPLNAFPECTFVICKPEFSVSTPEFFHALDKIKLRVHPDTQGLVAALSAGDLQGICRRMYNVFEDVPDRRIRVVSEIRSQLVGNGALGAIMTGTGSAVFGVFADAAAAERAAEELSRQFSFACTAAPVGAQLQL